MTVAVVRVGDTINSYKTISYTIVYIVLRWCAQCLSFSLKPADIIDPEIVKINSPEVTSVNANNIIGVLCCHIRDRLKMFGCVCYTGHHSNIG